jgi:hypothetical protein
MTSGDWVGVVSGTVVVVGGIGVAGLSAVQAVQDAIRLRHLRPRDPLWEPSHVRVLHVIEGGRSAAHTGPALYDWAADPVWRDDA